MGSKCRLLTLGFGFRVLGSRLGVWGLRLFVWTVGLEVSGFAFRVRALHLRLGLGASDMWL